MQYVDIVFVFTGDVETKGEREIVSRSTSLKAHILQLGHHGSRTSTTPIFLDAVNTEVAIYSAGEGNSYGHPHAEVIDRLKNIKVYGTDVHGTVKVITDGSTYTVVTSKNGETAATSETTPDPTPEPVQPSPAGKININTASLGELQEIIHIGEARAQAIIDGRLWESLDQLTNISGIAAGRLKDIKDEGKAYVD